MHLGAVSEGLFCECKKAGSENVGSLLDLVIPPKDPRVFLGREKMGGRQGGGATGRGRGQRRGWFRPEQLGMAIVILHPGPESPTLGNSELCQWFELGGSE